MKTVQQTLTEMDKEEVVNEFLNRHPAKLKEFNDDMTIAEAKSKSKELVEYYIDRLLALKTKPNKDNMIFYLYQYLSNGIIHRKRGLSTIRDLETKGTTAANYGIEYTEQAEIMGYFVAETELTQYYLLDLMQEILWDASFFGIEQENLEDALNELKEASEDEEGETYTSFEEMEKDLFGDKPLPPKLSKEDEIEKERIYQRTSELTSSFNQHLQEIEIAKILQDFNEQK
ncbi:MULTISPECIES: DUF6557 family protein [Lactobacillus]|uniref:DUF6557 family protein n=1 Tax=Lactobacillus TaxID=1578 RepID=UPI000CD98B4B|nr:MULTISPECIES: DUF6557 family protein [Lactobacillus]RVU73123.1 hypothetical protein EJK20_09540 [Lactobacillus xujianguonis]